MKGIEHLYKESSWCSNAHATQPAGNATILSFITSNKKEKEVLNMRLIGEEKMRKQAKKELPMLFGCGVFEGGCKDENITTPNGLIIADIDPSDNLGYSTEDFFIKTMPLPYVVAIVVSVGGAGVYCIIHIENNKSKERCHEIARSLEEDFRSIGLVIDPSCKNIGRRRYFGYSDRVWINDKEVTQYVPRETCRKTTQLGQFVDKVSVPVHDKISRLVNDIQFQRINLCPHYDDYLKVAFAFADALGPSGASYFHAVCQFSEKYQYQEAEQKYTHACKASDGRVTIATFYEFCKQSGLDITTDEKEAIIKIREARKGLIGEPPFLEEMRNKKSKLKTLLAKYGNEEVMKQFDEWIVKNPDGGIFDYAGGRLRVKPRQKQTNGY